MRDEDGDVCEWCKITVDYDGERTTASAVYKWASTSVEGRYTHDEDVTGWTDDEIRNAIAAMNGITGDLGEIEVHWN